MIRRLIFWALVAAIAAPAAAQQWPDPPPAQPKAKAKAKQPPRDDVEELTPSQIQRAQEAEPRPGSSKELPQAVKRPPKSGGSGAQARQIDCRGAFARDSSHIRLAQVFGPDNVTFTDVEGPENTKIPASVLFPRDPTRRLELLWNNTTSRSGTQVIVINGKSNWTAPRGVKLGAPLAAVEKLNGKPFKLTAFGADGSTAADWQEGQMLKLQGGCKIGMRFVADARAPQEARAELASAKELLSSDANVRALRPTVAEILIGY
ncbi:MAG: hypothetical protein K2Y71_27385 [Xanthobacteraceae bacterium]|nr:hypothetical protein [Xanthobacteraceae bacterium]